MRMPGAIKSLSENRLGRRKRASQTVGQEGEGSVSSQIRRPSLTPIHGRRSRLQPQCGLRIGSNELVTEVTEDSLDAGADMLEGRRVLRQDLWGVHSMASRIERRNTSSARPCRVREELTGTTLQQSELSCEI